MHGYIYIYIYIYVYTHTQKYMFSMCLVASTLRPVGPIRARRTGPDPLSGIRKLLSSLSLYTNYVV